MTAEECLTQLQRWVAAGWLRELDQVFAAFLAREAPGADPLLLLAAALASHQLGRGHVCVDLAAVLADPAAALAIPPEQHSVPPEVVDVLPPTALLAGVDLARWRSALRDSRLVAPGAGNTPLVLEEERLYLRRFWQHEQSVRTAIDQRLGESASLATTAPRLGEGALIDAPAQRLGGAAPVLDPAAQQRMRAVLDALFPRAVQPTLDFEPDWQKIACAMALGSRFGIVTGGPGTGKTTTVVKLLALLQYLALQDPAHGGQRLRIRLAAPTGKAAARLNASIANAVQGLALDSLPDGEAVRTAIPTEVSTVHRLLGSMGSSRRFRHDASNPLPLDVLVLDEASMVDLETMAAVLAALPAHGRLVLLGDKDQLASVEAGSVLGELCRRADGGHYRPATRDWLEAVSGERVPEQLVDGDGTALDQAVVKLRRSYRFDADSGIGQLAEAVNAGDARRVQQVRCAARADLAWLELDAQDAALRRLVLDGGAETGAARRRGARAKPVGYRHYLSLLARAPAAGAALEAFDAWARSVLEAHGGFQLLCAVRRGPHGVEALNQRIALLLHAEKLTSCATGWYAGRPVMVTRNDYTLGLMNGDVGIALPWPSEDGRLPLRVAFTGNDGCIRWILPSRLREVETVFAMTVHKSQGSEFDHAALLLPQERSRVLTRELVYTAITRARRWFTLAWPQGAGHVLEQAIAERVRRSGGLMR